MKKQILKDFELTEISGVDRPAQPTARVSIMKRAESEAGDSGNINKTTESLMTEKTAEILALEKSVADLTAKLEKADADKATAEAIAKMDDAEKLFISKMDDKEKAAWMKTAEDEKKKKMDAMKKNDETLVTGGVTISKRDVGDAQFALFKSLAERAEKFEIEAATSRLEKRASDELGNMAGKLSDKVDLLKALSTLPDQTYANSVLKAMNDFAKDASVTKGVGGSKEPTDAEAKIAKRASEIMKADTKVTKEQAEVQALIEMPELYAELEGAK